MITKIDECHATANRLLISNAQIHSGCACCQICVLVSVLSQSKWGGGRLRAIVSQMAGKSERMSRTKFAN